MRILGYIFTILNYILYCISRFQKQKKNMVCIELMAKTCMMISLAIFGSLTGANNQIVGFILLIVVNIKEKKEKNNFMWYLIFELVYIIILFATYQGISSVLTFCVCSITLFNLWWLTPQEMRLIGGMNSLINLTYLLSIGNIAGLLELTGTFSNFASYIKYEKPTKNKMKVAS